MEAALHFVAMLSCKSIDEILLGIHFFLLMVVGFFHQMNPSVNGFVPISHLSQKYPECLTGESGWSDFSFVNFTPDNINRRRNSA
jgi:hypothetical protein